MIDQQTVAKIRETAQILDVVSEFVVLRRRGQNYVGLCPFHADKSPSFYVSPARNICKCFSCNEGGDPVNFLMKHETMSYVEALRWLAKKYNIEIVEKELTPEEQAARTLREGMLNLNEFAVKTFEDDLYNTDEGRNIGLSYFRERGLQDETIKIFHLGYALENKEDFARRAMAQGHDRALLLDPNEEKKTNGVGLCYGDDPQKTPVCRFAGRVIFPYYALSGKPVAFGGRILQRVDHAFKKYVNSPESLVYHKSNMLYGIFQAKQEMVKQDKCYIVEGNVDVLSMYQAGFRNTVASAGTALTSSQIRMIKRFTNNVVLMYDGDSAGINATLRSIDLLLYEGMSIKLILLPNGDDPDSFCRQHTAADVKTFFDRHEQDFITYKIKMKLMETNNDPMKRAQVLEDVLKSISLMPDNYLINTYITQTAQLLDVDEMMVKETLRKMPRQAPVAAPEPSAEEGAKIPEQTGRLTDRFECNIIRNIVRYGGDTFTYNYSDENGQPQSELWRVIDFINGDLKNDGITFQHPLYARMLKLATEASSDFDKPFNSIKFFTQHPDEEIYQMALYLIDDRYSALGTATNDEDINIIVPRCQLELKEAICRQLLNRLYQQLRALGGNNKDIMAQIIEQQEIKKMLSKALGERIITG